MAPHQHARRGHDDELPVVLQREGTHDEADEREPEPPHGQAAVPDARQHVRRDEAGDGGEHVDAGRHEVGAGDVAGAGHTDTGHNEDDGEVEREGGELGALAGVGDPAEDGGPLLDRVGPHHLEEVAHLGLLEVHVLVRQHLEPVVEQLPRDLLGLAELPAVEQGQRGLRQVEPGPIFSSAMASQRRSGNCHRGACQTDVKQVDHHSAKEPSAWRQTGLRQRCPSAARSRTYSSSISIPRPGPRGMATIPSS